MCAVVWIHFAFDFVFLSFQLVAQYLFSEDPFFWLVKSVRFWLVTNCVQSVQCCISVCEFFTLPNFQFSTCIYTILANKLLLELLFFRPCDYSPCQSTAHWLAHHGERHGRAAACIGFSPAARWSHLQNADALDRLWGWCDVSMPPGRLVSASMVKLIGHDGWCTDIRAQDTSFVGKVRTGLVWQLSWGRCHSSSLEDTAFTISWCVQFIHSAAKKVCIHWDTQLGRIFDMFHFPLLTKPTFWWIAISHWWFAFYFKRWLSLQHCVIFQLQAHFCYSASISLNICKSVWSLAIWPWWNLQHVNNYSPSIVKLGCVHFKRFRHCGYSLN